MPSAWIEKRKNDQYYRLAKIRGYRSRAAYKLTQTVKKYDLIKPGETVLDLGCHPGGWLQVSREVVGPEGFVLGVDLKPVVSLLQANVVVLSLDIYSPDAVKQIRSELKGPADVVISDFAPSIIVAWDVDHARQVDLARTALQIAKELLRQKGNVLIKLFQGSELRAFQDDAALLFERSRLLKPKASRPESSEIYFLGLGFKLKWQPVEN